MANGRNRETSSGTKYQSCVLFSILEGVFLTWSFILNEKGKEPVFYFNKEPKLKGKCSSTRTCFCAEKMEKQDAWSQDEDMEDDFDEEDIDENQQGDIEGEDFFEELNSLEELL